MAVLISTVLLLGLFRANCSIC